MSGQDWLAGVPNEITFVMVDGSNVELTGLTLSIEIRVTGMSFAAAAGAWLEIGNGWYSYTSTAGEAVPGPISVKVTASGAVQQNLEYVCEQRTPGVVFYPYQVTDGVNPVSGAKVWFTLTNDANDIALWVGYTDATGYAYDAKGNPPLLPVGNVYGWKYKPGWRDVDNPDIEVVS